MPGRASGPVSKIFQAPMRGVIRSVPEYELGPQGLYACRNVVFDQGALTTRPGFIKLSDYPGRTMFDPSFDSVPLGAWQSVGGLNLAHDLFVATRTSLYRLRDYNGSWVDVSGTITLTAAATNVARFTSLYHQATGEVATIMVNGKDDMVGSLDGGNFVVPIVGAEKGIDITTAASRCVAIIFPYRVRWSDIHNAAAWPALNFTNLLDSPGVVVAIRNLGTQGVAVYKTDSIVAGFSQPGSPAQAFRWEPRISCSGPASASAVIDAGGVLFHMTPRGRIGAYDGTRFEWIGDGAWPYLLADFDFDNAYQTCGFYDEARHTVWFFYPRVADSGGGPTGLAIVTLPRPAWGVTTYGVFPGQMSWSVAAALTLPVIVGRRGFVLRKASPFMADIQHHTSVLDEGAAFTCDFTTGLESMPDVHKVEIEPFVSRLTGYGTATLQAVTSYGLGNDGGTPGTAQTVDLADTGQVRDIKGYNQSGRFIGLRMAWTSNTATLRYKGAVVAGHPLEKY